MSIASQSKYDEEAVKKTGSILDEMAIKRVLNSPTVIKKEPEQEPSKKHIQPFKGVMASMVEETLRIANKPQPELSILSALIGMASSIGGNYKTQGGARFNLYGIGISGTGTGKDKVMLAAALLSKAAGTELGGQPGSGAALEDMLEPEGSKILLNIDEVAHFIAAMNDSRQTHMASLSGNLLKLFSASRGSYHTRRLASSSNTEQKECVNPCVSMLGFACPEKLGASLGHSSNIEDGLLGRILFVNGLNDVKPRRDKGEFYLFPEIVEKAKLIKTRESIVVTIDIEADQKLDELLDEFDAAGISSNNPFAKSLKMRSFEKCERIAGVLAVWDNPISPRILIEHVLWAEMFIKHSDHAVLTFTENHLHNGQVQLDAAKIKEYMRKILSGEIKAQTVRQSSIIEHGYIPRSLALKASHLCAKDFETAVFHLVALEEVAQQAINDMIVINFI
jgi:hypothetical protein